MRDLCIVLVGLRVNSFGRLQRPNIMNEVLLEGFVYLHNYSCFGAIRYKISVHNVSEPFRFLAFVTD